MQKRRIISKPPSGKQKKEKRVHSSRNHSITLKANGTYWTHNQFKSQKNQGQVKHIQTNNINNVKTHATVMHNVNRTTKTKIHTKVPNSKRNGWKNFKFFNCDSKNNESLAIKAHKTLILNQTTSIKNNTLQTPHKIAHNNNQIFLKKPKKKEEKSPLESSS